MPDSLKFASPNRHLKLSGSIHTALSESLRVPGCTVTDLVLSIVKVSPSWATQYKEMIRKKLDSVFMHADAETVDLFSVSVGVAGDLLYSRFTCGESGWREPDRSLLFVENLVPQWTRRGLRYRTSFRVYGGKDAGFLLTTTASSKYAVHIIRRARGCRFEPYAPEDLGGLWLEADIRVRNRRFVLEKISSTSGQKTLNRDMLRRRKKPCTKKYRGKPCFYCELGMGQCSRSRHRYPLSVGVCRNTEPEEHTGILVQAGYCVRCVRTGKVKRNGRSDRPSDPETPSSPGTS